MSILRKYQKGASGIFAELDTEKVYFGRNKQKTADGATTINQLGPIVGLNGESVGLKGTMNYRDLRDNNYSRTFGSVDYGHNTGLGGSAGTYMGKANVFHIPKGKLLGYLGAGMELGGNQKFLNAGFGAEGGLAYTPKKSPLELYGRANLGYHWKGSETPEGNSISTGGLKPNIALGLRYNIK